jgi:hypothetical protein
MRGENGKMVLNGNGNRMKARCLCKNGCCVLTISLNYGYLNA